MTLILTIILVLIINVFSRVVTEKIREFMQAKKLSKELKNNNNFDINEFNIADLKNVKFDKNFWSDLENEDISTDSNNE